MLWVDPWRWNPGFFWRQGLPWASGGNQRLRLRTDLTADDDDEAFGALAFLTLAGLLFLLASEDPRFERLDRTLDFFFGASLAAASVAAEFWPAAASSAFSAASRRAASSSSEGTQSLSSNVSSRRCMLSCA